MRGGRPVQRVGGESASTCASRPSAKQAHSCRSSKQGLMTARLNLTQPQILPHHPGTQSCNRQADTGYHCTAQAVGKVMLLQVNNIFQRSLSTFYSTPPSAPQSLRYTTRLSDGASSGCLFLVGIRNSGTVDPGCPCGGFCGRAC
jgi:hypothetical protein